MIRSLKVGTCSLLITTIIVGTIIANSLIALAATGPQGPCGSSIIVDNTPANTSASCDMSMSTNFASGPLAFTNAATVTTTAAVSGTNNFSFPTTVVDLRNTDAGWRLEASSAGLTNTFHGNVTTIPLAFTSSTATCTPTDGQPTCVTPTSRPITLSTTPQYFLTTGALTAGNIISGTFDITTNGTYPFTGGEPAGTYTSTITIALVNAF